MENSKVCPHCKIEKPLSEYTRQKSGSEKRCSWCRTCVNRKTQEYRRQNPAKVKVWEARFREKNGPRLRANVRAYHHRIKAEFIQAYGGSCSCCGEVEPDFLTLEHLNGDGKQHRAQVGAATVNQLLDLRRRGWPKDGYTVLCMNCNMATKGGRTCPHKTRPKFIVVG